MKYAVINLSGSQHLVKEGDVLSVFNLNLEEKTKSQIREVLLAVNDKKVSVGTPTLAKASVDFEVVKNHKGDKLRVFKFKHKSRWRKTTGHRDMLTDIKITKLNF